MEHLTDEERPTVTTIIDRGDCGCVQQHHSQDLYERSRASCYKVSISLGAGTVETSREDQITEVSV